MLQFKGFVEIGALPSNSPNVVAPVGELSANSRTFAKDIKVFSGPNFDVTVLGFSCKNSNGVIDVPSFIEGRCVEIAEWVASRQKNLGDNESVVDFKLAIEAHFVQSCKEFIIGDMVVAGNGKSYPGFVTFGCSDYFADEATITLYFADEVFRQMYDEYVIDVIAPTTPLDRFFGNYTDVVADLATVTMLDTLDRIQVARSIYPETILTAEEYFYINPNNPLNKTKTTWTFLIYGPRGNDPDAIKYALIDYISRNSSRNTAAWQTIFPDIFRSTEFIIVPHWKNVAIQEMQLTAGIYSPMVRMSEQLAAMKSLLPEIMADHITNKLSFMGHPYKSLGLSVVSNHENREGKWFITDVFPDLICVSSTSYDFNRMSAVTRSFLEKLADMIYRAESATKDTLLPSGYRTTTRNGVVYITMTYQNVRYLVATRKSLP